MNWISWKSLARITTCVLGWLFCPHHYSPQISSASLSWFLDIRLNITVTRQAHEKNPFILRLQIPPSLSMISGASFHNPKCLCTAKIALGNIPQKRIWQYSLAPYLVFRFQWNRSMFPYGLAPSFTSLVAYFVLLEAFFLSQELPKTKVSCRAHVYVLFIILLFLKGILNNISVTYLNFR